MIGKETEKWSKSTTIRSSLFFNGIFLLHYKSVQTHILRFRFSTRFPLCETLAYHLLSSSHSSSSPA
ncbi:hypothetical protein L1887_03913 [Cichorium endivia]|nr:hypothetical protein L1887_03913 [Cichorium endivia]